jgi:DNA-binding MarR family transcriptional regulator
MEGRGYKLAIRKAIRSIEELRKLDQEMQMQTAMVFLLVAHDEGCNVRDIERQSGLSSASASRNVAALSSFHRKGRPGHNLIALKPSLEDRRSKQLYLTTKGRAVLKSILENFQPNDREQEELDDDNA